jgi:hypothetical protein
MGTAFPMAVTLLVIVYEVYIREWLRTVTPKIKQGSWDMLLAIKHWDDSWWGFGVREWFEQWQYKRELRRRRWAVLRKSKKSARMLITQLRTDDLLEADLSELQDLKCPVRVAYIVSRDVRRKMKNPKYSPANELVAWDVAQKSRPEGMRAADWNRTVPLLVKLVFMRDHAEEAADSVFSMMGEWVEREGHK